MPESACTRSAPSRPHCTHAGALTSAAARRSPCGDAVNAHSCLRKHMSVSLAALSLDPALMPPDRADGTSSRSLLPRSSALSALLGCAALCCAPPTACRYTWTMHAATSVAPRLRARARAAALLTIPLEPGARVLTLHAKVLPIRPPGCPRPHAVGCAALSQPPRAVRASGARPRAAQERTLRSSVRSAARGPAIFDPAAHAGNLSSCSR